ncbi:hypothetical protein A2Z23_00945 [Candidatus Curtissbacteria bacterium RBG_16_39_7]|uniref:Uncharacterized protein n=1 Tax=Candidatus Curtissbacteria bacterium RBG_16_39_7 TaxID=1797707 RepID=A0A1F5G311_9BACT|nr:MAG: hypothetical protein A2Z23_00945 [Candidatus Curtissbacteria bacterium RBG_16_39_7]
MKFGCLSASGGNKPTNSLSGFDGKQSGVKGVYNVDAMGKEGKEALSFTESNKELLKNIIKFGLIAVGAIVVLNWLAKL